MIGIVLIALGLVLWLALGYFVIGLILLALGVALLLWPGSPYGYGWYRGRAGPP